MTLQELRSRLPEYAKDTKLNLGIVLTKEGAPDLTLNQIYGIALASAYTTKHPDVISAILGEVKGTLSEAEIQAAKLSVSLMGMNNVYYRFVHLSEDNDYAKLPAKLRMNGIANSGVAKIDFELYSLAVSVINGCGMCVKAHIHEIEKAGLSKIGIQSCVRIAAVINAAAHTLTLE